MPHKRETWGARFGTLKRPVTMRHFTGKWVDGKPQDREVECPAGTRVRIVMVSRFGDVGITEDLEAVNGYGARVYVDDLDGLSMEAQP